MMNGSAGPTAELHQVDPFQQDLFQEDGPKELKEEDPVNIWNQQMEHAQQKEKGEEKEKDEEEEKEEESPKTPEEEKKEPDALDDLYTSLASSELYNNVPSLTKSNENTAKVKKKVYLILEGLTHNCLKLFFFLVNSVNFIKSLQVE